MTRGVGRVLGELGHSVAMVVIAFLLAGLIYELSGYSADSVFSGGWQGAFGAPGALELTLRWSIPLLIVAVGVLVTFKAGFFNIGAQGQLCIGAVCAYAVVSNWLSGPPVLVWMLTILAGIAGGALWALLAGFLRVYLHADEVLTTLMLNFIAVLFLGYMAAGPFKDPEFEGNTAVTPTLPDPLRLSETSRASLAIVVIAALVVIACWLLLNRTSFGVQSTLAGRNPLMARWQGVDFSRLGLGVFGFAGACAGLVGAIELLGPSGRLASGFAPTLGFTAVIVALVGSLSLSGVVLASFFFGALQAAIVYLPIVSELPASALDILQGLVALLITVRVAVRWPRLAGKYAPLRLRTADGPASDALDRQK